MAGLQAGLNHLGFCTERGGVAPPEVASLCPVLQLVGVLERCPAGGGAGLLPAALSLLSKGGNILCCRCRTEQQRSEDKQLHHLEKLGQSLGQSQRRHNKARS